MLKFGFYIMTLKGFVALKTFVERYSSNAVSYVVSARDPKMKNDSYDDIQKFCIENNIKFYDKIQINLISEHEDYKVAMGWRWIIKEYHNLIVFHDSLLPKYRGFAPLPTALINGDKEIGATALRGTEEYDRGEIILQKSVSISYPIKIWDAIKIISNLYAEMILEIYEKLSTGQLETYPQNEHESTYSIWLDDEDYFIDLRWDAQKIKRFVDAVGYPYDGAKLRVGDNVIRINEVEVVDDIYIVNRERHIGKVFKIEGNSPIVICGKGLIKIIDWESVKGEKIKISLKTRFK